VEEQGNTAICLGGSKLTSGAPLFSIIRSRREANPSAPSTITWSSAIRPGGCIPCGGEKRRHREKGSVLESMSWCVDLLSGVEGVDRGGGAAPDRWMPWNTGAKAGTLGECSHDIAEITASRERPCHLRPIWLISWR
jgi:hypothetical protein